MSIFSRTCVQQLENGLGPSGVLHQYFTTRRAKLLGVRSRGVSNGMIVKEDQTTGFFRFYLGCGLFCDFKPLDPPVPASSCYANELRETVLSVLTTWACLIRHLPLTAKPGLVLFTKTMEKHQKTKTIYFHQLGSGTPEQ